MLNINIQLFGGRGASSKIKPVSDLEAFKENTNQLNKALKNAKDNKASILEYQDITGKVHHRYWNGATYTDRKSSLYEKEFKGTYKAKFKAPKEWG